MTAACGRITAAVQNNHGQNAYEVNKGDKISQLVIMPIITPTLEIVSHLDSTERGEGGFGSTGR